MLWGTSHGVDLRLITRVVSGDRVRTIAGSCTWAQPYVIIGHELFSRQGPNICQRRQVGWPV